MPNVSTVTTVWQGFTGAPGYSKLRFFELTSGSNVQTAVNAVRTFFDAFKGMWQTSTILTVSPIVQHNDIATGDLVGETVAGTPPTSIAGTVPATTPYAGGSGFVINWLTGGFHDGRRVRGRTFIVPAVGVYFQDGTVTSATIATAVAAGNALRDTSGVVLGVWQRFYDSATPPNQTGGALWAVSGTSVPDRAAQLRTRRS